MNKNTKLLVDTTTFDCITYQDENYHNGIDLLKYGATYIQEQLNIFKRNFYTVKTLSQKKYWLKQAKIYRNKKLAVMTLEEFTKKQKDFYINRPLKEITEDDYYEHLDILPPLFWQTINGVNEFCMSEFHTGVFTGQYAKYNGKYYYKLVDAYDKSTWIHNYINK